MVTSLTEFLVQIDPQPRPYGLFTVAPPSDGGERWRVGTGMQSHNCMDADIWSGVACSPDAPTPKELTEWSCEMTMFEPFVVYLLAGRTGIDADVAAAELSAAFRAAEQRAVERQLWSQIGDAAVDLGPQPNPAYMLAVIEGNLATHYNGLGVIHMSPFAATILADHLAPSGDRMFTKACGTPVVIGSGYGAADDPTLEIYGTGETFVRRGDLDELSAWDLMVNDINALAERTYLVGWDCYAAKTTITPEAP
jgi:hypothetical protein